MSLRTQDAGKAATVGLDPEVTVHNRLAEGHRYRLTLDRALRSRLRELSGRWELSVHAVGRILIQIDVLAPGGSRWSLAVPVPEGPKAEDIVEAVWAGCARLAESEGIGGGMSATERCGTGTKAGRLHEEPAEPSFPNAPEGDPPLHGAPETGP